LQLEVAPSDRITTFGLEYSGSRRKLSLLERARSLTWDDIPPAWRSPKVLYLGPVAAECDESLLEKFGDTYAIGCIQGWLRDPAIGPVRPRRLPATCHTPTALRAVSFSASDHPAAAILAERLAASDIAVAVTRGRRGARVSCGHGRWRVPAAPAQQVDPTGAGDVFALVFGLSLWSGFDPEQAARRGALAAARVVEGPGLGNLAQARHELRLTR